APTETSLEMRELRERVLVLELNITEEDAARKKIESLLSNLTRRIDELRPLAALGLRLELYRGYETVALFAGRASRAIEGFATTFPEGELFQTEGAVAVFIPKSRADDALAFLSRFGFAQAEIPERSGDPAK